MTAPKPALGAFKAANGPKPTAPERDEFAGVLTAPQLLAMDFPEPKWAVPGLLAEGLTLLAGGPKIGKSWLGFLLAIEVARGGTFGKAKIVAGDVLYLALEDTWSRLGSRLVKLLDGALPPSRLKMETTWDTLPDGGLDKLDRWLDKHPDARLVVVDVLAKVRGTVDRGEDRYAADYRAASALKEVADRHGVAMLVLHHTRKMADDDFVATVSGTHGLAGAADAVLVLARSRNAADGKLHVTGRDIEEAEHALRFDTATGRWLPLDGAADLYDLSEQRRQILDVLAAGPARPKEIALRLGMSHEVVKKLCPRMAQSGHLDTDGTGYYFVPTRDTDPPNDRSLRSPRSLEGGSGERREQGERPCEGGCPS